MTKFRSGVRPRFSDFLMIARVAILIGLAISYAMGALSLPMTASMMVLCLSVRVTEPVSTINVIVLYWLLTFIIVAPLLVKSRVELMQWQFCLIQGTITIAYNLRRVVLPKLPPVKVKAPRYVKQRLLSRLWFAALALGFAGLAVQIAGSGVREWFSGAVLADTIENYSQQRPLATLGRAMGFLTSWTMFVLFALHREFAAPISRKALFTGFFGLPLIGLARQTLVYNGLFLLLTFQRKVSVRMLVTVLVGVIGLALFIGSLRATQLGGTDDRPIVERLVVGEYSSSIPFSTLIQSGHEIGLRWGGPIITPVLTGPVPRFMWPDKPYNGGAIYMQHFEPAALRGGYMYAINCFSDAYISFGRTGMILFAILLGWIYSGVDKRRRAGQLSFWDYLLIYNLYLIMRNPIATSINFMIYQTIMYWGLKLILTVDGSAKTARRPIGYQSEPSHR